MYGKKGGKKGKKKGGKKSLSVYGLGKKGKVSGVAAELCGGHCDVHGPRTSKGGMPANEKHT